MKPISLYQAALSFLIFRKWMAFTILTIATSSLFSQATQIKGVVTDENQLPFVGANIVLNHGKYGTVSDTEGIFLFKDVPVQTYTLTITAVGYRKISFLLAPDTISKPLSIQLLPSVEDLQEVKVKSNKKEKLKRTESISVQLIEEEFLKESRASSLMQTLNNIPGISSMDVGTGLSKPMIRGMGFYRVIVAQNGIKMEGQQWSHHHGVSVDQQSVSHVEIIKGPASLQYGSDAIGGVINILPAHVPLQQGVTGEVSLTGKSNSQWFGGAANVTVRKGDMYANIAFSHNSYGDFRIPVTDSFLLPAPVTAEEASHHVRLGNQVYNTAGRETALSLITGMVKKWGNSYIEWSYYSNQAGFFDWEGLRDDSVRSVHAKSSRDMQLPRQQVENYSVYSFTNRYLGRDKLEVSLGYQSNISKEYSYLTDRTGNRKAELDYFEDKGNLDLGLNLQTFSANVFYTLNHIHKQKLKIGLNAQFQQHRIDGYNHILPEYQRFSSATFLTHQYRFSSKWILNTGLRFDYILLDMDESLNPDPDYGDSIFNPALRKAYPNAAYSMGINFLPNSHTILKVNIGKSFRVPSAYELGAYGLHRHEGRFEKGDIDNKPEQAWQLDLVLDKKWNGLQLSMSPFMNYFTNYLYLKPTSTLRSEGQVYEYQQAKAMLAGAETSMNYHYWNSVEIKIGAEYVYGVNLDLHSALPFTPPLKVQTQVNYRFKRYKTIPKSKIGAEIVSVAQQKYTVPNELTTPGYHSLNLLAMADLEFGKQKVNIMLKVKNLLDSKYYNHISFYRRLRIPEPGRDFQLFIGIPF